MASWHLAFLSCALLGFRHGFDYDHLAAIGDIASFQKNRRNGMCLGLLYALGHAVTVAILAVIVLLFHLSLPKAFDGIGDRLIGFTLLSLSIYLLLRRRQPGGQMPAQQSRIGLIVSALRWVVRRVARQFGKKKFRSTESTSRYKGKSVFLIGTIHGIGAETPSQLLLFLLASHMKSETQALYGLGAFLLGLLLMNSLMMAISSQMASSGRPRLQKGLGIASTVYSGAIGVIFLFGLSDRLPTLLH